MRRLLMILSLVFGFAALWPNSNLAADAYYDAERSAKDFLYYYEDFTKLNKQALKSLVKAIAEADEDERREVAQRASREAMDKVTSDYAKAEKRKDEALKLLDAVLKDPALKSKHRDAEDLKTKVTEKWATTEEMSKGVRGANHPVTAYMVLHASRQRGCAASEFPVGGGFADCIRTSCDIIEFKPDNSSAKAKGEKQLKGYRQALLQKSDVRNSLNSKNSDFAKSTDFRLTLEACTLLPEITDDGQFSEVSASWSTYTVTP